jgi:tetratricopeptide (TPR) repeat protein
MTSQTRSSIFTAGLNAAGAGDLDAAIALFREVVALTRPDEADLSMSLGALGHALAEHGDSAEADEVLAAAVAAAVRSSPNEPNASHVLIARYFLGEHFLKTERPADALAAIEPALGANTKIEPLVRVVEALAAHSLGDPARALHVAQRARILAGSADQLKSIEDRLRPILSAAHGGGPAMITD